VTKAAKQSPARKAIGYIRVSTNRQADNGYGLDAQKDRLESYCSANGLDLVSVIPDVMSGRKTDKLYGRAAAIAAIKAGIADVLLLNALDRATRDTLDGLALMKTAQDEGWQVIALDGTDSEAIGKLELTIKLVFAEEERAKISERTKQGLARAKREGKQLGKPSTISRKTVDRIVFMRTQDGMGPKAIAAALTEAKIPAPRGDVWHYSTVRNVLAREGFSR
jgi:DNA invertase Pin-like site-specific DNA recombinase